MLSKQQLIERIRDVNRSALREWLDAFNDSQLRRYLEHLQLTREPRSVASRWVRDGSIPALLAHVPE